MSFPVYDSKINLGNQVITPEIRACFSRLEPGKTVGGHTHDLGHELFLVLEGRAEFEIDGDTQELGPGQMCIALAGQMHYVRCLGDTPMTMYYSVTPHIQPTHTRWTSPYDGQRIPHEFQSSLPVADQDHIDASLDELVQQQVNIVQAISSSAQTAAKLQQDLLDKLKAALSQGDNIAITSVRNAIWETLMPIWEKSYVLAPIWNNLATRLNDKDAHPG
jgi:quercetin dioxygenase-like cupin family protein